MYEIFNSFMKFQFHLLNENFICDFFIYGNFIYEIAPFIYEIAISYVKFKVHV